MVHFTMSGISATWNRLSKPIGYRNSNRNRILWDGRLRTSLGLQSVMGDRRVIMIAVSNAFLQLNPIVIILIIITIIISLLSVFFVFFPLLVLMSWYCQYVYCITSVTSIISIIDSIIPSSILIAIVLTLNCFFLLWNVISYHNKISLMWCD